MVAIIVALGIRAYFVQPFKIPTASMQPTLNGITARGMPPEDAFPNFIVQGVEYLAKGRNYVEMKIPQDWKGIIIIAEIVNGKNACFCLVHGYQVSS